jgi:hypothetical protein
MTSKHDEPGGCGCGAIRFLIPADSNRVAVCHCQDCRRFVGAQSVAWVMVAKKKFKLSSGKPVMYASSPGVVRTFCGKCGTSLTYAHSKRPDTIDVTVASLDKPSRFRPIKTTFEAERIEWCSPI